MTNASPGMYYSVNWKIQTFECNNLLTPSEL